MHTVMRLLWSLCRDDFFKQFCQDQSTDELYEHIEKLNKNLVRK